jgi:hypothetical protein
MSFANLKYDPERYDLALRQSTGPMKYELFLPAFENPARCHQNRNGIKYLQVDVESDIKGLNTFHELTKQKFHSSDGRVMQAGSNSIISTYDPRAHVNTNPEVCSLPQRELWFNSGLQKPTNPGFLLPGASVICGTGV